MMFRPGPLWVKPGNAQNEQVFSGCARKRTSDLRICEYRVLIVATAV
jgi:hypothetical protein